MTQYLTPDTAGNRSFRVGFGKRVTGRKIMLDDKIY